MTTTTVEVEEVTTVEEELTLCDNCSREVDDDGLTFHNHSEDHYSNDALHFCSECLEDMGIDVVPEHIIRVEEWYNYEQPSFGKAETKSSIREKIERANAASKWLFGIGTIASIVAAFGYIVGSEWTPYITAFVILGALGALFVNHIDMELIMEAMKRADKKFDQKD